MNKIIISNANDEKAAAEFNVYSEISDDKLSGKIILQPVNNANKDIKIYLDKPITADNPFEIQLYYKESENTFYFENEYYAEIIALICYDLGIGIYNANPDSYEYDLHDHKENYPYTYFNEIDCIRLKPDELIKIKDYHVVLEINETDDISIVELIKYKKVKPKLATPKTIKGTLDENTFDCIEIYDDKIDGGVV